MLTLGFNNIGLFGVMIEVKQQVSCFWLFVLQMEI
jgi:hypothetical protein